MKKVGEKQQIDTTEMKKNKEVQWETQISISANFDNKEKAQSNEKSQYDQK